MICLIIFVYNVYYVSVKCLRYSESSGTSTVSSGKVDYTQKFDSITVGRSKPSSRRSSIAKAPKQSGSKVEKKLEVGREAAKRGGVKRTKSDRITDSESESLLNLSGTLSLLSFYHSCFQRAKKFFSSCELEETVICNPVCYCIGCTQLYGMFARSYYIFFEQFKATDI